MRGGVIAEAHANKELAWSSDLESKETMESRRLGFEIERETRRRELEQAKIEVEKKRARTEEEREARLQRKEEIDARIEELIIKAQQVQTAMLMKMMEMFHRRES
jgi:hypothetical protein